MLPWAGGRRTPDAALGRWPQNQGRGSLLLVQQVQPEQHHGGGGPTGKPRPSPGQQQ
jgi:hypothetical protein